MKDALKTLGIVTLLAFSLFLFAAYAHAQGYGGPQGGPGSGLGTGVMTMPINVSASAVSTSVPYSCWKAPTILKFVNEQVTAAAITESVATVISLCDTGTSANPSACGTDLADSAAISAVGNQSVAIASTNIVPAGDNVCVFFKSGTATAVTLGGVATAVAAGSGGNAAMINNVAITGVPSPGQAPVASNATQAAWGEEAYLNISAGTDLYGNNTDFPTGQQIIAATAGMACHFTNLTCINVFHSSTCTTAPTVNVFDGASNTGTAHICSGTLQSTRGTVTTQSESQTISAGDTYGIYVSTAGGTCVSDLFAVSADVVCP